MQHVTILYRLLLTFLIVGVSFYFKRNTVYSQLFLMPIRVYYSFCVFSAIVFCQNTVLLQGKPYYFKSYVSVTK